MKIVLIGYGKMGKEMEKVALSRGHEIVAKIDPFAGDDFTSPQFATADVAIEFTTPQSAFDNYMECFKHNIPVVSGTTGWLNRLAEVKEWCANSKQTFFYASNFSIGVNIFFELNKMLARLMNDCPKYEVSMTETHHVHKLDAPSGTAISLAESVIENIDRKTKWELNRQSSPDVIAITAIRESEISGIHTVKYESPVDEIEIRHSSKSRQGLAFGAILAAEFAAKRKGFLTMKDMLSITNY
ncbi:MAG: 4-hydroxy-tetrahydrodipicolinate reductase [Cytophagaceae bacterium]|jgi:4-hydroxy-tetrahydrodipicolinate reductase|nr:4-hydroxy-tetrahydrodipicolinate reductase [Cytophagaceae bacterium]